MITAVYAGTFDPITFGHLDIIKRSRKLCSKLVIGVGINSHKKTLFTVEERVQQIIDVVKSDLNFIFDYGENIVVSSFSGLLVDFASQQHASLLVRGIRSVSDFEYEITIANANKLLAPHLDTIFLPTSPQLSVVSSSAVKEVGQHGGALYHFVPPAIERAVRLKFGFAVLPDTGFVKYGEEPRPDLTYGEK